MIAGKINVLELIHNPGITGPGRIVSGLARYIDRDVFELDVLCPADGYLPAELSRSKTRVIALECFRLAHLFCSLRLRRHLRSRGYHVFHIHSGQLSMFGKVLARSLGIPAVLVTEHLAVADHRWIRNPLALKLHLGLHYLSGLLVDKVIAVSQAARTAFIARQNIAPEKVETVYNGVELDLEKPSVQDCLRFRARWDIPEQARVIAVIGRLSAEKGQEVFLRAAGLLAGEDRQLRFVLAGDGPLRQRLQALADGLGLHDQVVFAGFVPDIAAVIAAADLIVQPSWEHTEAFGLSLVEAMAAGKPVVASDITCFREIIEEGSNGLFFAPGDHVSLAEKMRKLLHDAVLSARLARSAQETARARFGLRANVARTQQLYIDVLRAKGYRRYAECLDELLEEFLACLCREHMLDLSGCSGLRDAARGVSAFLHAGVLSLEKIRRALQTKELDIFLAEKFVQFIRRSRFTLERSARRNLRLLEKALKSLPVSSEDYDRRIASQSDQFQIDNYYLPKDRLMAGRIASILEYLEPVKDERILDIGCGVGTFVFQCGRRGAYAWGIDYSGVSLQAARRLAERFGISGNVSYLQSDISGGLPFSAASFDKIVSADFIEHIDEQDKAVFVKEIRRVLKPAGLAVVFTPNGIREWLGAVKAGCLGLLGRASSETRLHFGLTNRFSFERMLKENGLVFQRVFLDGQRPYLARIPLLREVLSLNILWVIKTPADG